MGNECQNHDVCTERFKNIDKRLDKIDEEMKETKATINAIHELTASIKTITEQNKEMKSDIGSLKNTVDEIRLAPVKKFNEVWMYIVTSGIGLLLGWVFTTLIG